MKNFKFKIIYKIDSDIPGDSCLRSRTISIDAENEDDAFEDAHYKYQDQDFHSIELLTTNN